MGNWKVEHDKEAFKQAIRDAKTVEEIFDLFGMSHVGPEAYYVEIVWEAMRVLIGGEVK